MSCGGRRPTGCKIPFLKEEAMTIFEEKTSANFVLAIVVRQKMQTLFKMIGCKVSVGGLLSPPSNPKGQPWIGNGNY